MGGDAAKQAKGRVGRDRAAGRRGVWEARDSIAPAFWYDIEY